MNNLNHISVIGHLVKDVGDEHTYQVLPNGTAKVTFTLAVNESIKKGDSWENYANYFDVTVWGKQGERLKDFLKKGKQVCVDGRLKQDRWEKDNVKNNKVYIVADTVYLLGGGDFPEKTTMSTVANAPSGNNGFPEDITF